MIRLASIFLVAVVWLVLAPSLLLAQSAPTSSVSGQAIDLDSLPIDQVRVEVINSAGDVVKDAVTYSEGRFQLKDLAITGPFDVRFSKIGRVGTTVKRQSNGSVVNAVLPLAWQRAMIDKASPDNRQPEDIQCVRYEAYCQVVCVRSRRFCRGR